MYANYVTPRRYSKLSIKGYFVIALVSVLISSTIGA